MWNEIQWGNSSIIVRNREYSVYRMFYQLAKATRVMELTERVATAEGNTVQTQLQSHLAQKYHHHSFDNSNIEHEMNLKAHQSPLQDELHAEHNSQQEKIDVLLAVS